MADFPHTFNKQNVCIKCGLTLRDLGNDIWLHTYPSELNGSRVIAPRVLPCSGLKASFQKDKVYPLFYHKWDQVIDTERGQVSLCVRCGVMHTRVEEHITDSQYAKKKTAYRYLYRWPGLPSWIELRYGIPCPLMPGILPVSTLPINHKWHDGIVETTPGTHAKGTTCERCGLARVGNTYYFIGEESSSCGGFMQSASKAFLDINQ